MKEFVFGCALSQYSFQKEDIMITLLTSFYQEAEALIEKQNLKKESSFSQFQLFSGSDIRLLITGTGNISSAVALTYLLTKIPPTKEDLYLNIGVCGCNDKKTVCGTCFICNQITEQSTHRIFYPDILYSHPFLEAPLITSPVLVEFSNTSSFPLLFDMEAASLYQAGMTFLQQHQMLFLKIVSDPLTPKQVATAEVSNLMKQCLPSILTFLDSLKIQQHKFFSNRPIHMLFSEEDEKYIKFFSDTFSFSVTRTEQLKQLLRYAKTLGISMDICYRQLEIFKGEYNLLHIKQKGGEILERFRQFIFQYFKEFVSSYLY